MKISIKTTLIIAFSCMLLAYLYSHISIQKEYKTRKVVEKVIVGKYRPQYYILFEEDGTITEREVSAQNYIYYQKGSTYSVESTVIVWK